MTRITGSNVMTDKLDKTGIFGVNRYKPRGLQFRYRHFMQFFRHNRFLRYVSDKP
jgi:hypothetical protein